MTYGLHILPVAEAEIEAFIDYVAITKLEPVNAGRLLVAIYDGIDSLETLPDRCPHAPENELVDYEVRVLIVKKSLLVLFKVDEARQLVVILGFRHGRRQPLDLRGRRD